MTEKFELKTNAFLAARNTGSHQRDYVVEVMRKRIEERKMTNITYTSFSPWDDSLKMSKQYLYDHIMRFYDQLTKEDIRCRFSRPVSREYVENYVDTRIFVLPKTKDMVYFAAYDSNRLVGLLEVVYFYNNSHELCAEIAVMVHPEHRNKGIGSQLMSNAIAELRSIDEVKKLVSLCLTENNWMVRLAKKHGMKVTQSMGDAEAELSLVMRDKKHDPILDYLIDTDETDYTNFWNFTERNT